MNAAQSERIIPAYPGNKSVGGLYHLIINNIPPHKFYYELFAGSAEIARRKSKAEKTIINDIDATVYCKLLEYTQQHPELNWHALNENALNILTTFSQFNKSSVTDSFIYMDPPYIGLKIYKQGHELELHQRLIVLSSTVKANVMISQYEHPLYDELVNNCGWRKEVFNTAHHGKKVVEAIYMNYAKPKKLHDYSLLGKDCWHRQGIKRKIQRHITKLENLPALERHAIIQAIKNYF